MFRRPAVLFALVALRLAAADFYVAPTGSDTNAGTIGAPFATITRARDAIRVLKANSGLPPEGVTVWLRGGYYNLGATVVFNSSDSGTATQPVNYVGYPGEEVHITGAVGLDPAWFTPVTAASPVWSRLDPAARGQVVVVDLPAHGLSDFGTLKVAGYGRQTVAALELFQNDRPMTLARWPNADAPPERTVAVPTQTQFTYAGDRPARWTQASAVWVHGYWKYAWADYCLPVASIDTATHTVSLAAAPISYGMAEDRPYFFTNLLEEIDQPGEYYLDRATGQLFFWPAEPLAGAKLQVSLLAGNGLVQVSGAKFLTFADLTFEVARTTLVTFASGDHNRLVRCLLRNSGQSGARVAGSSNTVDHCEVVDCGESAVRLGGGDRPTLTNAGNVVSNSRLHRIGRLAYTYHCGVVIEWGSCGNQVVHNLIDDLPHAAVLFTWGNNHTISGNEIRRVCRTSSDAGAIYLWQGWAQRGHVVAGNFVHDVVTNQAGPGVHAIYLDNVASGLEVTGNVIYRVADVALFASAGRDDHWRDNVIGNCEIGHFNYDCARRHLNNTPGDSSNFLEQLTTNGIQYQQDPWASAYPELAAIPNDWAAIQAGSWLEPQGCVFERNAGWGTALWMTETDRSGFGVFSAYASIAGNTDAQTPLFDDDVARDRSLRPTTLVASPAGFVPIPFAAIGRDFSGYTAATMAPRAPRLVLGAVSATSADLEWTDDNNLPCSQETGFVVERRNEPDGAWVAARTFGPDVDYAPCSGLAPDTRYSVRIRVQNAAGAAISNAVTFTTAPAPWLPGATMILEAESNFQVAADVGSYGTVGVSNGTLDSGNSVRLYDVGDAVLISFSVPVAGRYRLGVRMRSGTKGLPYYYWAGDSDGVDCRLDGAGVVLEGDRGSLSAFDTGYGGCYWGTMMSGELTLAAGAHTLRIAAIQSWSVLDYVTWTELSAPPVVGFGNWQAAHFAVDQQADPAVAGASATPLGDGVSNLLKYALGHEPWARTTDTGVHVELVGGHLQLEYARPVGLADVVYSVEASSDLTSWTQITASPLGGSGGVEVLRAIDPMPAANQPRRFLRLRLTLTP